jgi:peroxiredoxin
MKHSMYIPALWWAAFLITTPAAQAEPSVVGQALVVTASTQDGAKLDAGVFKNKVSMVFYWSTRCAVCISHLAELRANLAGWKDKPFVLITVNVDADAANWRNYENFVAKTSAARPISLWEAQGATGKLPITLVADSVGTVKYRYEGRIATDSWDNVAELLP